MKTKSSIKVGVMVLILLFPVFSGYMKAQTISGEYKQVHITYTFYVGGSIKVDAWGYKNWTITKNSNEIEINGYSGTIDNSNNFQISGTLVGESGGLQNYNGNYDPALNKISGTFIGTVARIGTDNKKYIDSISNGTFSGTKSTSIIADFTGTPLSGTAPLTVQFTDQSTGEITSRLWDFGDGQTSTDTNPLHVFQNAGNYTIKLTVTGTEGSNTKTRTNFINVSSTSVPVANFHATPESGVPPLTVHFTNLSTGTISDYLWEFGDGDTSTEKDPLHVYNKTGINTARLTVTGEMGTDSDEKQIMVFQSEPSPCTFSSMKIPGTSHPGAWFATTADFNNDNKSDILISAPNAKTAWYVNKGNGNFSDFVAVSASSPAEMYALPADLDGDGKTDIVSCNFSGNKIVWHKNSGSLSFSNAVTISTAVDQPVRVFASDLDGDGDLDVLSASQNDHKIAWYKNNGNGTFGTQQVISLTDSYVNGVFADDLNGDGKNDIVTTSLSLNLYVNEGNGDFSDRKYIDQYRGTQSIYSADIDNDGDPDLVTAKFGPAEILWYKNDGNANFSNGNVIFHDAQFAKYAYPADFDLDGNPDIVAAVFNPNMILWFKNQGNGLFGPMDTLAAGIPEPGSVVAADLDQDGDQDILAAFYGDGKAVWYENQMIKLQPTGVFSNKTSDPLFVSIYPNPAGDIGHLQYANWPADHLQVELLDLSGRFVRLLYIGPATYQGDEILLDLSDLDKGFYLVRTSTDNGFTNITRLVIGSEK